LDAPRGVVIGEFNGPEGSEIRAIELPSGTHSVVRKHQVGYPVSATISPDGARVAFLNAVKHKRELRIVKRDGTDERLVVQWLDSDELVWSPDGALLLASGGRDDATRYVIDPDRNRYWVWKPFERGSTFRIIRWTGDGRGVFAWDAFSNGGRFASLVRCDFDGAQKRCDASGANKKLKIRGDNIRVLEVSPDEKSILFSNTTASLEWKLWVSDLAGANRRAVLSGPMVEDRFAIWSPDGEWIGGLIYPNKDRGESRTVLTNIRSHVQRQFPWAFPLGANWWAPRKAPPVDARAIITAALGPGTSFTPPLATLSEDPARARGPSGPAAAKAAATVQWIRALVGRDLTGLQNASAVPFRHVSNREHKTCEGNASSRDELVKMLKCIISREHRLIDGLPPEFGDWLDSQPVEFSEPVGVDPSLLKQLGTRDGETRSEISLGSEDGTITVVFAVHADGKNWKVTGVGFQVETPE
jgi:hypothetical protein